MFFRENYKVRKIEFIIESFWFENRKYVCFRNYKMEDKKFFYVF